MLRVLAVAAFVLATPRAGAVQVPGLLHIRVVLTDAERKATPVPRHVLLISDNPTSAPPRRIVTALDGTAEVTLRPGNYTVESDRPAVFQGRTYQWVQTVDVVAGGDAVLELTNGNAEVEAAASSAGPLEADPSILLTEWQESIVALWTPTTHASGFVVDARGLIVTNQRVVGAATSVEVQLTPAVKVAANVIAADSERDVAVLRVDPKVLRDVRPVPLPCGQPGTPVAAGQDLFTIGTPLRGRKRLDSGTISRVEPRAMTSDLILPAGSAGGPVFGAGGAVVGLTTARSEEDEARRLDTRVVRVNEACVVIAAADGKIKEAQPPDGVRLPVEPERPFPMDTLREAVQRRAGSLLPYEMSSADFDVAFMTPVQIYGAQYQAEQARERARRGGRRSPEDAQALVRRLMDFRNWSDYVSDLPPVLLIRVTPKLVEGFWTMVARGAARTQGMSLPPLKHVKSGFGRIRVLCGEAEVTPIHAFKIEQRISDRDTIYEGLDVLDPGALGPQCGTVKLVLYAEKEPGKGDSRVVDPKVIQQIWDDFALYRQ